jgi:hypothetical protein
MRQSDQLGVQTQSSRTSLPYPLLQNRACQVTGTRLLTNRVLVLHTLSCWQIALTKGSVTLLWQLKHRACQLVPDPVFHPYVVVNSLMTCALRLTT